MTVGVGAKDLGFENLKGVDGQNYSFGDFSDAKVLVVIFSCNHCPYVIAYENRYVSIQKDYSAKGVRFVAINANDDVKYPEDGFEKMIERAKSKHYNFPYLRDEDQAVAMKFGATNTPHVFVFDQKRVLKYSGRIDDNWENPDRVMTHDLRNVLDALIQGKEPPVSTTLPVGCSIKWK